MSKRAFGFTFVEVLLTTFIFSIIMLSIYSIFSTGNNAYKKMDYAFTLYQEARVIFNRMEADLKNSFAYSKNNSKFSGSSDKITFFTVIDSYARKQNLKKVSKIQYEFGSSTLTRSYIDGLGILKSDSQETKLELADQLQNMSFEFAASNQANAQTNYDWQTVWPKSTSDSSQKGLPLAIKVELTVGGIEFKKIIALPQSYYANNK